MSNFENEYFVYDYEMKKKKRSVKAFIYTIMVNRKSMVVDHNNTVDYTYLVRIGIQFLQISKCEDVRVAKICTPTKELVKAICELVG